MDLKKFFRDRGYGESVLAKPPPVVLTLGFIPQRVEGDLVVLEGERPLLVAGYAPGAVRARERALVAYARLAYPQKPPPLVLQTNGREFSLLEVASGKEVAFGGPEVIPPYEELKNLSSPPPLDPKRKAVEEKVLFIQISGG